MGKVETSWIRTSAFRPGVHSTSRVDQWFTRQKSKKDSLNFFFIPDDYRLRPTSKGGVCYVVYVIINLFYCLS